MACRLSTQLRLVSKRFVRQKATQGGIVFISQRELPTIPSRSQSSVPASPGYQLWGGVCLERPPIITRPLNALEADYQALLYQLEHENSHLSEHEVHLRNDVLEAEKLSQQEDFVDADATRQTALDLEDVWESHYNKFSPAPRITDADKRNDYKSLKRKLERKLILVVKQKLGEESVWILPQGHRTEGESMRQTAERVLQSNGGDSVTATFLGNAPCGLHAYKLPLSVQSYTNCTGIKVFFFKAHLRGGEFHKGEDIEDYLWLTKEELKDYLSPSYYKNIKDFILEL